MSSLTNKIAIFIVGPNLYATSKTLGFDVDFRRLLSEFGSRGKLFRSFYYGLPKECSSSKLKAAEERPYD